MSVIEVLKCMIEDRKCFCGSSLENSTDTEINALDEAIVALEQKEKIKDNLLTTKKSLKINIDNIGNLNISKNRNKLWFLTGELNIIENILELMKNDY